MSGALERPELRLELIERHRAFDGWAERYRHVSATTRGTMHFSIYRPPQAEQAAVPTLYYLAGLTCTDETFMHKASALRWAADAGLFLVAPDTSPRATGIVGEEGDWEVGVGAGFYLDATVAPWAEHYRMESYVTVELPALLRAHFPVDDRESIFGHSMGGHGALVLALRHPGRYRSVSAFAPICAPSQVRWGHKAFSTYLGNERSTWQAHDATALIAAATTPPPPLLIDQGLDDKFLSDELRPELLEAACAKAGLPLTLRRHAGYDHSYHFVSTFMKDHIEHHARTLCRPA